VGKGRVYGEFVGPVAVKGQPACCTSKPGCKRRHHIQKVIADYYDDSRFSAISSILETEFQLRPVPGVLRIL
jgi:hypothetical protein